MARLKVLFDSSPGGLAMSSTRAWVPSRNLNSHQLAVLAVVSHRAAEPVLQGANHQEEAVRKRSWKGCR